MKTSKKREGCPFSELQNTQKRGRSQERYRPGAITLIPLIKKVYEGIKQLSQEYTISSPPQMGLGWE